MRSFLRPLLLSLLPLASLQAGQVIFAEVMYHPPGGKPEYVEITNLTSNRLDMARWTVSGGVDYTFPDFSVANPAGHFLKEYERVVVSSADEAATRAAWPTIPITVRIFGPWTGSLNNGGETIALKDAAQAVESTLTYGDGGNWPLAADGAGHSLQIINPNGDVDDWRNWGISRYRGGSPGVAEPTLAESPLASPEKADYNAVEYTSAWKYWREAADPDGAGAEGSWFVPGYDDSAWSAGPGFFGHDPSKPLLQAARGTSFTTGYATSTVTYYFRTTFNWSGALSGQTFALDQWLDDGAIYYLNGKELKGENLGRIRMAAGAAAHGDIAIGSPAGGDAVEELNVLSGSLDGQLVSGANVLCAEVHQNTVVGDDIYFGARLRVTSPAVGGLVINEVRPAAVAGVGFVEFYNPGPTAVDLNGYYLSDSESNLTKYRIAVPTPVAVGGVAVVGFAESGLSTVAPVTVLLTQPDGFTRQNAFRSSMLVDGRSAGRRPSGGSTWVLFAQPTPGQPNVTAPTPTLALSEVHFGASGRADWVEFFNTGSAAQALDGYFVSSAPDLSDRVALGGSLASGGYGSAAVDFAASAAGELTLYVSDLHHNIAATARVKMRAGLPSAQTWPAGAKEWYATPTASRDAPNNPQRQSAIVINEIMGKAPSGHEGGEFIELYNQSGASVDLGAWRFVEGVSYSFAAGTSLGAGQYLVLSKDPSYLRANYPGVANVVGPFGGTLRNSGEQLRLEDAVGNLADVVDYRSGGQWPTGASGEGSSLELLHPAMDNSQASAWRASDESKKSSFQSFSYSGVYKEQRGVPAGNSSCRELLLNMVADGYVILRNIKLVKDTAPSVNLITTGDATSHNGNGAAGFLCTGTHCESDTLPRAASPLTGDAGFHLISRGSGDTKANKAEVDVVGMAANTSMTLSFEGRWVQGLPLMVAQTWDRSFGKVFRFPVPGNLGTPGAANSRSRAAAAPTVDAMKHFPVVPTSVQPVVVSARVTSAEPLSGVALLQRQDTVAGTAAWINLPMNDSGTAGDVRADDGIWSATVPARATGAITQFYIKATAANGQENDCPRTGVKRPGMWIVSNAVPSAAAGLLIQRGIISLYDRAALNPPTGYSAAYDYDHPRMSNYGFNATFIFNESEVMYNCELRRGGSPWTRIGSNLLDRTRWKPPGDQLFRGRTKSGVDNDATNSNTGPSRFHNRLVRYMMHLFGYPVPEAEFIQQIINADAPRLGDEQEQTDTDFFDRAYPKGTGGELYEIDDAWFMYDTNNMDDRLDAGSVTGSWAVKDYSGGAAMPSDESPLFFHGNWPLRFPEDRYDYASLSSMIKTATNNSSAVSAAQDGAYRERMERVLDSDRAAIYAAVRGYVGDWDNFTLNRGKNGYFYRRPTDGLFEFHHWDSDLAFQNTGEGVIGSAGGIGWTNLSSRPWFRQKVNYYMTELIDRYANSTSARMNAWLAAMNYQSANTNALAAFKTAGYNYPATWFTPRNSTIISSFLTAATYNRAFSCTTASGQTVATPAFSLTGAASSKVALVDIPGHPEAVFTWTPSSSNFGLWTLSNVLLVNGVNNLSLRALRSDGVVSATLPFSVTLSGNAPPVASLVADPASGNLASGETLSLDATGSVDPEGTALAFAWSVSPTAGASLSVAGAGQATVRFAAPGSYTVTLQVTDGAAQTVAVSRDFSVYNAADFSAFGGSAALSAEFAVENVAPRGNFSPSGWYSLEDQSGRLLIQVLDDSAKPLASPSFTHPLVSRDLPDSTDFLLQTSLAPDTREFGNWRAGLLVQVNEGGSTVRYAFGLDGGLNLLVQRAALPDAYATLSTTPVTGSGAVLRVQRLGNALVFQRQASGSWVTVFSQAMAAGAVAEKGGMFVATSAATTVRVAFDYLLVADPAASSDLLKSLRLTELHYRPAAGGVEFLELRNVGDQPINLQGASFALGQPFATAGVPSSPYTFGAEILGPGEFLVLTDNAALFRSLYGSAPRLAPVWSSGSLSNSGEQIVLLDAAGNAVHSFTYGTSAPWPLAANGTGPSMEVVSVQGDYSLASNWRASTTLGGSPGSVGAGPDSDGDGVPDQVEALFGLDPNSPGLVPMARLVRQAGGGLTLSWPSIPGVTYRVESSAGLSGWQVVQTLVGAGTWSFTPAAGEGARFYRVTAAKP